MVDEYLIQWERDISGTCSDEDTDSTTISGGSATSHTIPGLEEDSTYTITVTAANTAGSSAASNTVTAMTLEAAPSAPPSSVSATVQSSTSITVQWGEVPCIHQNGDITGYSVQYRVMGSGDTPQTMPAMGNGATIYDLTPSTNDTVQVAAVNSAGVGDYSDPPIIVNTESKSDFEMWHL